MSDETETTGKAPDRIAQLAGLAAGVALGAYVAAKAMSENDNSVFGAAIMFVLIAGPTALLGWKFVEAVKAFLSGELMDDWEKIARRQGQMEAARKAAAEEKREASRAARNAAAAAPATRKAPAPAPAPEPAAAAPAEDAAAPAEPVGPRPAGLAGPRDGAADDLKRIKGVGPKLERQLNAMGFWHFDQIAAWSEDEVAWVDANLEGLPGRASRDGWVSQARLLASGGETDFSRRVDDGDVY